MPECLCIKELEIWLLLLRLARSELYKMRTFSFKHTSFFAGLRPAQKLVSESHLYHIPYHISYQIFYHISYQVSHHIIYYNRYHVITLIIIYIILFKHVCGYWLWSPEILELAGAMTHDSFMTISFSSRGTSSRTAPNCLTDILGCLRKLLPS